MAERQQQRGAAPTRPAAWELEFEDAWEADDQRARLVADMADYFASPAGWTELVAGVAPWHGRTIADLDWQALCATCPCPDLQPAVAAAPVVALGCIACAAYEVLFRTREAATRAQLPALQAPGRVLLRLRNMPGAFRTISSIKADCIGRLVSVRGTVVRSTAPQPLVTSMEFVCGKCGAAQRVPFPDGRYTPPAGCAEHGCRSRTFMPVRPSAACIDWQRVALQGLPKDERAAVGRVPVPIGVELTEDLVGACAPGDVATVVGIVKVQSGEAAGGKKGGGKPKDQCLFLPYIQAVSVTVAGKESVRPSQFTAAAAAAAVATGADSGGDRYALTAAAATGAGAAAIVGAEEGPDMNFLPPNMPGFSELDLQFICTFTETCEGDQLRQLVHSLCPSIFGHELVKAGLLLALFGGVRKAPGAEGEMALRGDVHILMVGDPGLGKSQLLQAAAVAAPRGVYVCGNTSSAAGLTVSVVRENGEFAFDAGALVLADRGVCCIDEFDKISSDHQALLGAMEQQEVSVAKAGMVASLPARTTVLAAANPVEGSYNKGKTLLENLKCSPAMLSRFDLVFLLLDRPDAERDQRLSEHVMALHSGKEGRAHAARARLLEGGRASQPLLLTDGHGGGGGAGRPPLLDRLRMRQRDDELLPVQLLRKYIAYARQYVHPRLTGEAMEVLKDYYLQLRAASAADPGSLPVTARQLESLVRLSEARARVELREEVTRQDAEDVVEIMRQTLDGQAASPDALPMLDFTRGGGRAGSQATERRRFLEALARCCQAKGDSVLEVWEMQDCADRIGLQVPSLQQLIGQLNEAGDLLKKGGNRYQVSGVSVRPGGAPSGGGGGYSSGGGDGYRSSGGFAGAAGGAQPAASQQSAGSKRSWQQAQPGAMPPPPPRW